MVGGARLYREGWQEASSGRVGTSWWGNRGATHLEDKLSPKRGDMLVKMGERSFTCLCKSVFSFSSALFDFFEAL